MWSERSEATNPSRKRNFSLNYFGLERGRSYTTVDIETEMDFVSKT